MRRPIGAHEIGRGNFYPAPARFHEAEQCLEAWVVDPVSRPRPLDVVDDDIHRQLFKKFGGRHT
jgi:hypothetical protein